MIGCTVLILFSGRVRTWVEGTRLNITSIDAARQLVGGGASLVSGQDFMLSEDCQSYPELIQYYYATYVQQPEDALRVLTAQQACGQRSAMLQPLRGEILARLGRAQDSCAALSEVKATALILNLAQQARRTQDWASAATFVDCVERLKDQVSGWISPYIMGDVYYALGQHYDTTGEAERALEAYQHTIDWYPGWASPVVRRAKLLMEVGQSTRALQELELALKQAREVTARWELVNTLAPLWEAQSQLDYAYCAYQEAVALIPALPPAYEADQLRPRLMEQINRLQAIQPSLESTDCHKLLAAPAAQ